MKRLARCRILLALCFTLGYLSACQFQPAPTQKPRLDIGDGGFLSGEPCGPPCFWGITLDVTTKEDAVEIFQAQFDIEGCDQWPDSSNSQDIFCDPVGIQFNTKGIVDHISFSPLQPITVGDVVAKYGQPNAVEVLGWSPDSGITTSVTMLLFFDDIQTVIGLGRQPSANYKVESSTPIGGINYAGIKKWKAVRENASQSWIGFGIYQGPYWAGP